MKLENPHNGVASTISENNAAATVRSLMKPIMLIVCREDSYERVCSTYVPTQR
jgi:hypothetical protein